MKRLTAFLAPFFFAHFLFAQSSTSTITPQINGSGGLSLDQNGNLYIADFGDFLGASDGRLHNIWKLDPSLNLTTFSSGFWAASGNDFDSSWTLYQSDIGANGIYKIVNGFRTLVTNDSIVNPVGIVFDSKNNFYVCNCGANTIRKFTPAGVGSTFSNSTLLNCPNGITVDEDDNLYVSNFSNGGILKIDTNGVTTQLNATLGGVTSGPSNGHLDYHAPTRNLYIASHARNQIYEMSIDNPSQMIVIAGSGARGNDDNTNALQATFSRPNGVAVTKTGDTIYINSSIPVTNTPNRPLNPSVVRMITGVQFGPASVGTIGKESNASIFPNPAGDRVWLKMNGQIQGEARVKVFDAQGSVLFYNSFPDGQKLIENGLDFSRFPNGVYFIEIRGNSELIHTQKVLKEKN